jgi:hypothetical protein
MTCLHCGSAVSSYRLKLIPATQYSNLEHPPQFLPQIREDCANCGKYKKFAKQDTLLVARFNAVLEGVKL